MRRGYPFFAGGQRSSGRPFNPDDAKMSDLRRIRGAIWPNCNGELVLPLGPRPGRSDNIIATNYLFRYPEEVREPMAALLRRRGYWNVDTGPAVGDYVGYHGQYPNPDPWDLNASPQEHQRQWDKHLDEHQWWWDRGFAPAEFLHPDGWSFEQTRDFFTPFLLQPRTQHLFKIVVPTGWEPTRYDWSNKTWCMFFEWARQCLPKALLPVHTVSDVDACVGTDENGDDNNRL